MRSFFALRGKAFMAAGLLAVILPSLGCIPVKPARVAAVALTVEDVARAASKQTDPTIVREGTPAYLMLLDGLLEAYPENRELLSAACQANSTYASSFLNEHQRDVVEKLYDKAKKYGFRSLSVSAGEDFVAATQGSLDEFNGLLGKFRKDDVAILFWTANAWAGWVSVNAGEVDAMADLPVLEATMSRILELDDTFQYGAPHLLLGVYLAAKPRVMGGDSARAKLHFDRAFALGASRMLAARVLYAEYYARAVKDRSLFVNTLREVIGARADEIPELTLANVMAQEKARRLLEKTEEYFGEKS